MNKIKKYSEPDQLMVESIYSLEYLLLKLGIYDGYLTADFIIREFISRRGMYET